MDRRTFMATVTANILAVPLVGEAQHQKPRVQIGILQSGSRSAVSHMVDALRQGLQEHGWMEGTNVTMDYRFGDGQPERVQELATELVRLKVDIIVAGGTPAAFAASKATKSIPVVFWAVQGPVELGLVASLGHPGGNLTGVSYDVSPETNAKTLQLLKEIVPKASRIAVLRQVSNRWPHSQAGLYWKAMFAAAQPLGITLRAVEVSGAEDLDKAFATIITEHPDALFMEPSPVAFTNRKRIIEFLHQNRLAAAHGFKEVVEAGGLMSYGPSLAGQARRSAYFVDKILKGAKPGDFPVEQPTIFEMAINLKTAKALGLTIPQSVLLRADEIFQ